MKVLVKVGACGALLLTACAIPPEFILPDAPVLPKEWGGYNSNYFEGSECPEIAGAFSPVPEIFKIDTVRTFSEGDEYIVVALFPFDLATKETEEATREWHAHPVIEVLQDADHIVLVHFWANGQFVQRSRFSSLEGDFSCRDGFIEFPISEHFGQIEGTAINGQMRRRVRTADDGSLIVVRTFGPSRAWWNTANTEVSHQYFRFRKKGDMTSSQDS